MTILPKRGQYQPKYLSLTVILMAVAAAYGALFYVEEALSERDYSAIPSAETRVAYCMANSLSSYEKHVFAQSMSRPSDPDLYALVLSASLAGEPTGEKQGAIRALRERDELRRHASQIVIRAADKCQHDRIAWRAYTSPLTIMVRWLPHDDGFRFFLARAKQSGPDAAERFYRVARKEGSRIAEMPAVKPESPGFSKCVAC